MYLREEFAVNPKGPNILYRSQLGQKDLMIQMLPERINEKDEMITDLKETIKDLKETIPVWKSSDPQRGNSSVGKRQALSLLQFPDGVNN